MNNVASTAPANIYHNSKADRAAQIDALSVAAEFLMCAVRELSCDADADADADAEREGRCQYVRWTRSKIAEAETIRYYGPAGTTYDPNGEP